MGGKDNHHGELWKDLKFSRTTKSESVLENKMHEFLQDFRKRMDSLILDGRIDKKNLSSLAITNFSEPKSENQGKRKK